MQIGPHLLSSNILLAPMAGVTDKPFRQLCRKFGAGMAVSEMITSNPALFKSRKSLLRTDHVGEISPITVQIAGSDPDMLAMAAKYNVDHGAEIIDINMGCPAKKVCNVMAGSSLMRDELLVGRILDRVVNAVDVPVTLKIRTGWDSENKNAIKIAKLAEQAGIKALTVHGRTRACRFKGKAEHVTSKLIKHQLSIPVIANGDICTAEEAVRVLACTNVDGIMIGRGAQGNPWIFREINTYLKTGKLLPRPDTEEYSRTVTEHLEDLYTFYGKFMGVRIARKHIGWYCRHLPDLKPKLAMVNQSEDPETQLQLVQRFIEYSTDKDLAA